MTFADWLGRTRARRDQSRQLGLAAARARYILLMGEGDVGGSEYRHAVLEEIQKQDRDLGGYLGLTFCPCGGSVTPRDSYRCFRCGIYWCQVCAKRHFKQAPGRTA